MDLLSVYHEAGEAIVYHADTTHAMMHIHVGMAVYVATQLIVRDRRASSIGLQIVFGLEVVNEVIQRFHHGHWRWPDPLADVAPTMMWPTILFVAAKLRRRRWEAAELRRLSAEELGSIGGPPRLRTPIEAARAARR